MELDFINGGSRLSMKMLGTQLKSQNLTFTTFYQSSTLPRAATFKENGVRLCLSVEGAVKHLQPYVISHTTDKLGNTC